MLQIFFRKVATLALHFGVSILSWLRCIVAMVLRCFCHGFFIGLLKKHFRFVLIWVTQYQLIWVTRFQLIRVTFFYISLSCRFLCFGVFIFKRIPVRYSSRNWCKSTQLGLDFLVLNFQKISSSIRNFLKLFWQLVSKFFQKKSKNFKKNRVFRFHFFEIFFAFFQIGFFCILKKFFVHSCGNNSPDPSRTPDLIEACVQFSLRFACVGNILLGFES